MTETDTIATAAAATPATEEATDLAALAELTAQRSAVYRLLARLYRVEVDEEFLAELKTMRFPAATGNTAVDTGYRTIATYLSGADAHAITDLAVDYVRAFIGHGIDAYSAAYPFESVYTSPKRLMMQEARDEVLAVYRSEGLDKLPTWKEAEDHIALELEFMAALGDRIVAAAEADDEAEVERLLATQRNFLADHLSSWVPLMTADLATLRAVRPLPGPRESHRRLLCRWKRSSSTRFSRMGTRTANKPHHGEGPWVLPANCVLQTQGRMREEEKTMAENDEKAAEAAPKKDGRPVITRRALCVGLGGTAALVGLGAVRYAGSAPLVRPPGGQDEDALVSACIRCEKCYEVCPPRRHRPGALGGRSAEHAHPRHGFQRELVRLVH